jgi:hypothetical protein
MASTVIDTFVSLVLLSRENDIQTFARNERGPTVASKSTTLLLTMTTTDKSSSFISLQLRKILDGFNGDKLLLIKEMFERDNTSIFPKIS